MARNHRIGGVLILMLISIMIFKSYHNNKISHNQEDPSELAGENRKQAQVEPYELAGENRKQAIINDPLKYLFEIEVFTRNFESKKRISTTDKENENDILKLNNYLKDLHILKEVLKGNEFAIKRVMHNIDYINDNLTQP